MGQRKIWTGRHPLGALPLLGLALTVSGCGSWGGGGDKADWRQGWSPKQQADWYAGTQGSRLMPYSWFKALEQPGSTASFADQAYLASFGYIPSDPSRVDPLPVGFAIDQQADSDLKVTGLQWYAGQKRGATTAEKWVGLNCAACHTAEITYQGKPVRIDGGPSLGDYQSFVEALDNALHQTQDDPARFNRFAAKVLNGKDTAVNRALLKQRLSELVTWEDRVERINDTPLRYGYARVDAFGHIYNKVALYNGADPQVKNPSDAPVSYPHLWDISRQTRVQWNGSAKNQKLKIGGNVFDYGALGRNAGEVIGVFGEVAVVAPSGTSGMIKGYKSSVQASSLISMEAILAELKPPKWPAIMPPADAALVAKGQALFDVECASCHIPRGKWVEGQPIERMVPIRNMGNNLTDIWMACNAADYFAFTGQLEGTKSGFFSGPPLGKQELIITQLQTSVKGALIGKKGKLIGSAATTFLGIDRRPKVIVGEDDVMSPDEIREARRANCMTDTSPILEYKARPLDGIWATAPYLHNGSVPTLWHLLMPAKDRPTNFWLGSREYDPVAVGYVWDKKPATGQSFEFRTVDANGKVINGNANSGHEYGVAKLSEGDNRKALLEYLKTL
jgi:mono/diheme cytochrome c family protein